MVSVRRIWRNPIYFLAMGCGMGLMPIMPGTFGSLLGLLIAAAILTLGITLNVYLLVLAFMILSGVWLCDSTSRALNTGDDPSIVWDEIVGMMLTLVAVPVMPVRYLQAFICFRLFDIIKPWPISWLDRHIKGGLGIMIDDIIAGVMACACMHILMWTI